MNIVKPEVNEYIIHAQKSSHFVYDRLIFVVAPIGPRKMLATSVI